MCGSILNLFIFLPREAHSWQISASAPSRFDTGERRARKYLASMQSCIPGGGDYQRYLGSALAHRRSGASMRRLNGKCTAATPAVIDRLASL
jgi:hypothetical protein